MPNDRIIPHYFLCDYDMFQIAPHEFARDEMLAGRFPLWLPFVSCGTPYHASQLGSLCHPTQTPLILLCGANRGLLLNALVQLGLLYVGQYLLGRRLGITCGASAFSAVVVTQCTYPVAHLMHGHLGHLMQYALLPWFLLALATAICKSGPLPSAALAVVPATMLMGGHQQLLYYTLILGTGLAVGSLARGTAARHRGRTISWLVAAAAVSCLLSAVQVIPIVQLVREGLGESQRGTEAFASGFALDGLDLLRMLVPSLNGNPLIGIPGFDTEGHYFFHERVMYLGLAAPVLAVVGLLRTGTPRWTLGAAWAAALSLPIALGSATPLFAVLGHVLPGLFLFRCPGRVLAITSVLAALLAGRGLDALVGGEPRAAGRDRLVRLGPVALGGGVAAWALATWARRFDWGDYWAYAAANLLGELTASVVTAGATVAVLVLAARLGRTSRSITSALLVVLTLGDLGYHNVAIFRLAPPLPLPKAKTPLSAPQWVRFLDLPPPGRHTRESLANSHAVELAVTSHQSLVGTADGGILPRAVERLYVAIERDAATMLPFCGCDFTCDRSCRHWTPIRGALPRFRVFAGVDVRLCNLPVEEIGAVEVSMMRERLTNDVVIECDEPRRLSLQVNMPMEGRLVVAETYFPGWSATVDGRPVQVIGANGVFRSVSVGAGKHRVEFRYDPASFTLGLVLSAVGIGLALSLVVVGLIGARR
jgi:hypothetical protein